MRWLVIFLVFILTVLACQVAENAIDSQQDDSNAASSLEARVTELEQEVASLERELSGGIPGTVDGRLDRLESRVDKLKNEVYKSGYPPINW